MGPTLEELIKQAISGSGSQETSSQSDIQDRLNKAAVELESLLQSDRNVNDNTSDRFPGSKLAFDILMSRIIADEIVDDKEAAGEVGSLGKTIGAVGLGALGGGLLGFGFGKGLTQAKLTRAYSENAQAIAEAAYYQGAQDAIDALKEHGVIDEKKLERLQKSQK